MHFQNLFVYIFLTLKFKTYNERNNLNQLKVILLSYIVIVLIFYLPFLFSSLHFFLVFFPPFISVSFSFMAGEKHLSFFYPFTSAVIFHCLHSCSVRICSCIPMTPLYPGSNSHFFSCNSRLLSLRVGVSLLVCWCFC